MNLSSLLNLSSHFKYMFWDICPKKNRQEKNLNYVKMTRYSWRFSNYIKSLCVKMTRYSQRFLNYIKKQNVLFFSLYTLIALLSKNWFYFFFLSSDIQKFHHLLGCHAIGINSSLVFFLTALRFSCLLCQAESLTIFL